MKQFTKSGAILVNGLAQEAIVRNFEYQDDEQMERVAYDLWQLQVAGRKLISTN